MIFKTRKARLNEEYDKQEIKTCLEDAWDKLDAFRDGLYELEYAVEGNKDLEADVQWCLDAIEDHILLSSLQEIEDYLNDAEDDEDEEDFEESLNEGLQQYDFTKDGNPFVSIIASSEDEARKKVGIIEKKRNPSRVRPLEEIHKIAMKLYDKEDDFSFNLFSDEELAMLFANTLANPDIPYDDEVYDAIYNFPNRREIFDRAHELARDMKREIK